MSLMKLDGEKGGKVGRKSRCPFISWKNKQQWGERNVNNRKMEEKRAMNMGERDGHFVEWP